MQLPTKVAVPFEGPQPMKVTVIGSPFGSTSLSNTHTVPVESDGRVNVSFSGTGGKFEHTTNTFTSFTDAGHIPLVTVQRNTLIP